MTSIPPQNNVGGIYKTRQHGFKGISSLILITLNVKK